jgi:hypothetical protein
MTYTPEQVLDRLRVLGALHDSKPFTPEELAEFAKPPTDGELAEIQALKQEKPIDWPLEDDPLAIALGLVPDPQGRVPHMP